MRGAEDPALCWTVEVSIPGGDTSPDPDAPPTALKDEASAGELAARLKWDGFAARVEKVSTPRTADYAGGPRLAGPGRIVRHVSAAESANARPAPIDMSVRVVEADPAVTVNGEPQGVVRRGL